MKEYGEETGDRRAYNMREKREEKRVKKHALICPNLLLRSRVSLHIAHASMQLIMLMMMVKMPMMRFILVSAEMELLRAAGRSRGLARG